MGFSKDVMSVVHCTVSINGGFTRYYQYVVRTSGVTRVIGHDDYGTKTDMAFSRVFEYEPAGKHRDPTPTRSERNSDAISRCPRMLGRFLQVGG
jgi:hypothetical protein